MSDARILIAALLVACAPARASEERLGERIEEIRRELGASRIAIAFHDHQTGRTYARRPDDMFSAASMIKAAVMVAVHASVEDGRLALDTPVRVVNRFPRSGAAPARQTVLDGDVHAALGSTLTLGQLTEAMVARSSNLATNVLIETLGLAEARRALAAAGVHGLELRAGMGRGARHGGNMINASGFADLLDRLHAGRLISPAASERMLATLFKQAIGNGIPAGLPPAVKRSARIAHKTGNIPTAEHDAALVYLPGRAPIALVILTDWPSRGADHPAALVQVTRAVWEELVADVR